MSHLKIWTTTYQLLITNPDKPFNVLSVQDICNALNIHRSTFYRYFDSKDDLLDYGLSCLWSDYFKDLTGDRLMHPFETAQNFMQESEAKDLIKVHFNDRYLLEAIQINTLKHLETLYLEIFEDNADYYAKYCIALINFIDDWNQGQRIKESPTQLDLRFQELVGHVLNKKTT